MIIIFERIIEIKDIEISLIKRLKDMGLEISYRNRYNQIDIEFYHKDDIVDKELYLKDLKGFGKDARYSPEMLYDRMVKHFSKIANVWK